MRFILVLTAILCISIYNVAEAEQNEMDRAVLAMTAKMRSGVWYDTGYSKPVPTTLKGAIAADKELRGSDNPGSRMRGSDDVCAALKSVRLPCDYNTRSDLTMFLAFYGKGLFPAAGGTNPYCTVAHHADMKARGLETAPENCFIGRPIQNKMLAEAVRRNAKLFRNGDLTADDVKKRWK